MKVELVAVRTEHIADVCQDLRDRERQAFYWLGEDAEQEVAIEVMRSVVAFAGVVDGKCVALWGAKSATVLCDMAHIWLICARQSETLPITFLRHSRIAIDDLQQRFRLLYGYVLSDFDCSVRWLKWLGFSIDPPVHGACLFYKEQ